MSCGAEKTSALADLHKDVKQPGEGQEGKDLKDARESFDIGPTEDSQYPNVWPKESELPGFRAFMEGYFQKCRGISMQLVEATAMGLDIPATAMLNRCVPDRSEARLNFYPEISVETLSSGTSQRIWPHTDFGIITLIFQDSVGGLELEDRLDGRKFVPVAKSSQGALGELVVNTADCMQRWTNDAIKAGLHQVSVPLNLKKRDSGVVPRRVSCPFFLKADYDESVGPLPQFVLDQTPAGYDEITAIEYHRRRVGKLFVGPPHVSAH